MKVGVPTEIKEDEYRVALTPAGARELAEHGHEVIGQAGAGEGRALSDARDEAQGARRARDAAAELVHRQGAYVSAFAFVIELESLGGRHRLLPAPVISKSLVAPKMLRPSMLTPPTVLPSG